MAETRIPQPLGTRGIVVQISQGTAKDAATVLPSEGAVETAGTALRNNPKAPNRGDIRVPASKMDFGTPKHAPSGSRLCTTPKSVQVPGGIKTHPSLTQDSENQAIIVHNFTTYSNPAFEPNQTKCVLEDSNGSKQQGTTLGGRSATFSSATGSGATFLQSPAARVRPDGTREEYHPRGCVKKNLSMLLEPQK